MKPKAEVGVLGGSGFYEFLDRAATSHIKTPYGAPSAPVAVSKVEGRAVAFLPRHGIQHEFPPHAVPYLANVYAFKKIGVTRVLGPSAVGSLRPDIKPGEFVFCDQFVNLTSGRKDTYYNGPETTHVSAADPYCPELRKVAIETAGKLGVGFHPSGTVVVIQGPRFSTRAESRFFRNQQWEVINMTQYPEAILARELELCYLNISLVTDYDVGLEGDPNALPVSHEQVVKVFGRSMGTLRKLIVEIIKGLPDERGCGCSRSLEHARIIA